MQRLSTWRLVPLNLDHALWTANSMREQIYVRARNATKARLIAAEQFSTAAGVRLPGAVTSPWLDRSLVICVKEGAGTFSEIDRPGVIDITTGRLLKTP